MPRKFLVIDDDAGIRGLLRRFLESKGCRVSEAADGIEAVKRFEEDRPDVVLLDILLPKAIGFEVCRKIKGLAAGAKTPVLMMSAVCKTTLDELQKNFQCPADGFLTKPFQFQALLPYLGQSAVSGVAVDDAKQDVAFADSSLAEDRLASATGAANGDASKAPGAVGAATVAEMRPAKARPTLLTARVVSRKTPAPPAAIEPSSPSPPPTSTPGHDVIIASTVFDEGSDSSGEFRNDDEVTNPPVALDGPSRLEEAPRENTEWLSRLARTYLEQVVDCAACDLVISRAEWHRVVSFAGGVPVDVNSRFRHENLGTFLMMRGDITEAEYNDCLEHMISHGCSVDESTVHLGLLAPAQVVPLTLAYKVDLLASAFAWKTGDVTVRPPSAPTHVGGARVRIDPIGAALEGVGRVFGDQALRTELARARGKFLVRVRDGGRFIEAVRPTFDESLWRALWEGRTAVHELAEILGPKGTDGRRAVKLLEVVGAIRIGDRDAEVGAASVVETREGDDETEVAWETGTQSFDHDTSNRAVPALDDIPDAATEEEVWNEALRVARLDHFAVLGVPRDADPVGMSRALRRFLLRYDPLRMEALRDPGAREKAWEIIERVASAFGALADGEFRAIYDQRFERAGSQPLAVPQIDPEVQFARGKNLIVLEDYAGAQEAFRRALEVHPDFAEAHLFLGLAMYQADPRETVARDAIGHMSRAIEIDPKNDMAYYYLGQVYRRLGMADKARTMFQRAVELNLSNVLANRELKPGR